MDASFPLSSSSHGQATSPKPISTRSGLTLVLPSLKNLKAANDAKKSKFSVSIPSSPAFDVEVFEKKAPRPVKLKPIKEVLTKLIQQIKKKDDYAFFLQPVNPNQVPGYLEAIKIPMDLGTMTSKVNRGKYRTLEDFASDLKLVTNNAKTFNPPGSIYYTEAERIEAWALDHIAKASSIVIQNETDWNIDIEKDDDASVNVDEDDIENPSMSIPPDDAAVHGRSPSVASQFQQPTGRRGPRGPYKKGGPQTTVSESIDSGGRLPGSKDGIGTFPPCSDWAKTMVALKLKGKRYKTKKERLRFEKEGPPYLPDGSLDYTEMEDPFSVLCAMVPDPVTRPYLIPLFPPLSAFSTSTSLQLQSSRTHSTSDRSTPQPEFPIYTSTSQEYRPVASFPSAISLPLNYDPLPLLNLELSPTNTYPKRRHWHIVRNAIGRKGKDNLEDLEADEPPWHVGRNPHPVDFGSFATLMGALSDEMKKRGVTPGVLKDAEEEKVMFDVLRDSLDQEVTMNKPSAPEDDFVPGYPSDSISVGNYFTSERAAEADQYIRDVVYGGVDGFAYVRSLAEFVESGPVEGPRMSLNENVRAIVDELTDGRHSLLRETARSLSLQSGASPGEFEDKSPVATQTISSLYLSPKATAALQVLLQLKSQKIDMSALFNKPEELFLSEEEWAGKSLKDKRKTLREKMNPLGCNKWTETVAEDSETMEMEENSVTKMDVTGESHSSSSTSMNATALDLEGPEELDQILDYVADLIIKLNRRISGQMDMVSRKESCVKQDSTAPLAIVDELNGLTSLVTASSSTAEEDSTLRNLRLNLLALATRAPLDTIARLPLELVPEHIRHYIPTQDTSVATSDSTPAITPIAPSPKLEA